MGSGRGGREWPFPRPRRRRKQRIGYSTLLPEQRQYALELDQKSASLRRSIQELRLRIPPSDISQRLPHLHAHSLASNAALTLQLSAHSFTREQAQLRETTLEEENAAYGKAISNCEKKIKEKLQEADLLQAKLKEMDETEKNLRAELEKVQAARDVKHVDESLIDIKDSKDAQKDQASRSYIFEELEAKRKELAQAEGLATEIHLRKLELEKLNSFQRSLEDGNTEVAAARNRFGKSSSGGRSADYIADNHLRPSHVGGRTESLQRLMLFRSAFVLYILALHILVFIKISF
ncbi:hypothetical protein Sjap_017881 [Stephania japonica]|uniref:Uncharacterized protein n=1 Tax=Stephania japonica TaxID=461633 RepID=A0AAP0I6Y9_9MAGN